MKLLKKSVITVLAAVVAMVLVTACRTSTKTHTQPAPVGQTVGESDWQNVYANVNVYASKPMSMNFSGRLTMERDRYIHLSMRFIGMEVAVLYMNVDSVYFVDKYHKYFYAEPLPVLLGSKYDYLTLGDLQRIYMGLEKLPDTDKFSIKQSDFQETPAGTVALSTEIFAETPQATLDGAIEWKKSGIRWNEPDRTVSFKVPANCRRITNDNLKNFLIQ